MVPGTWYQGNSTHNKSDDKGIRWWQTTRKTMTMAYDSDKRQEMINKWQATSDKKQETNSTTNSKQQSQEAMGWAMPTAWRHHRECGSCIAWTTGRTTTWHGGSKQRQETDGDINCGNEDVLWQTERRQGAGVMKTAAKHRKCRDWQLLPHASGGGNGKLSDNARNFNRTGYNKRLFLVDQRLGCQIWPSLSGKTVATAKKWLFVVQ